MPSGADGSIVIDTQLDNTGFSRGSQQMQTAVNRLNQTVNQVGKNMASAVQSMNPALQNAGRAAQEYGYQIQSAFGPGAFDRSMAGAQRSINSLASQLTRLGDAERMGIKTGSQMTRFQINTEKARETVSQLAHQLDTLGQKQVNTQEYEQLASQIQKAEASLFRMYDRRDLMEEMGVDKQGAAWTRLDIQIRNAENDLARYESSMRALQASGESYTAGANSPQFQQMSAQLAQMSSQLEYYEELAAGFDTLSGPAANTQQALENVDQELQQKPGDANTAQSALSAFGSALLNVGRFALTTAGNIAKLGFKGLVAGAKGAGNAVKSFVGGLKNITKHGKQSALTTNGLIKGLTGFKRMLLSRIKRTFISSVFNSMKAGMQSFARYSSTFNAAMSGMKNSMSGLSGNLAVFAAGLINALAPAITTIIDWISTAISYLNAFFALLSGKSTYSVAKKGTDDYAKSLKGAGGAAKDLKNQVYGFDELNREQDNSGGGGGGGSSGDVDFEEKSLSDLPGAISDFMQSIKDAFSAGEFEKVGEIVAGGLNTVVTTVDGWINNTFRPAAVLWTSNIARILNGFVSGFDWSGLGKLIADAFNTITDVLNTFFTTFDFAALASQFAAGVNGIIDNVDWALLGATVGNGLWGLNNAFWGGLAKINWTGLGSSLATSVNTMFASVNWAQHAQNISGSIKGALDGITTLLQETDWQAIGNDIATFVGAIDWNGLVDSLMTGIGAALGGLAELLWGIIEGAWDSMVSWWNENAYEDGQFTIEGLLNGILNAIAGIGQWIVDHIFTPFINGFKSIFGIASPSTVMEEQGGYLIDGLLQGITAAWESITEWFTGILDALGELLSGAWETIKGVATTAWEGITGAVTGAWDAVSSTVSTVWDGISSAITTAWDAVSSTASSVWDGITGAITTAWDAVSGTATQVWDGVSSAVTTAWDAVSSTASTVWDGVSTAITNAWDTVSSTASTVWDGVSTAITNAWDTVSSTAATVWDGVSSAITGAWDTVSSTAATVWGGVSSAITGAWDTVSSTASSVWNGITGAITSAWNTVSTTVSGVWDGVSSAITTAWDTVSSTAGTVWDGVTSTISSAWDTVSTTASTTWEGIKGTICSWFGLAHDDVKAVDWSDVGTATTSGVESGINSGWDTFKSWVKNKFTGLVNSVKSALGIASPSKVFAGIGGYMMEGLVVGMEDEEKTVDRTMSNIAESITNGLSANPQMSLETDTMVNGLDRVTDKLSRIAEIFSALASAITSMNGLNVPGIASGAFVPYKTRVSENIWDADGHKALSDFQQNFDETMSDQRDVLREILEVLRTLNLTVDGDSLTRAITSLQRKYERAFGGAY